MTLSLRGPPKCPGWRDAALRVCVATLLSARAVVAQPASAAAVRAPERAARQVPPAPSAIEGHVLTIEEGDLIVDITSKDGVSVGDDLELWRPLKLVHPVTRKVVTDRYRIGTVRLTQVRPSISLGHVDGTALRQPAVGDIVLVSRPRPANVVPSLTSSPAAAPVAEGPNVGGPAATETLPTTAGVAGEPDPETHAVSVLFEGLRGASLTTRIRRYERYAHARPNSPFVRVLLEEAAALRELVSVREQRDIGVPVLRHFDAPSETLDKTPLDLSIEVGGRAAGAVLQARNRGEVAYRPTPMAPAGAGYFTATLPAERVVSPGLEYFIEATRDSGQSVPVAGTAERPLVTTVHEVPHAAPPLRHESSLTVVTDYADYNRLRGNDHVWQTEGTFGMRFSDVGVRALRSGFGVYRGVGGSIDDLDVAGLAPRSVGLTYGHLEGEFGIRPTLSIIVRAVLGLGDDGTTGGAQLHLRIGSDQSTNLSIGGEVLGGIGIRGITQLEFEPRGRFPILIRSEVTNQPAGVAGPRAEPFAAPGALVQSTGTSDIGVRAILQVGYRVVDSLVIAVRGSYQGRTIDHAGPGLGGAVEYRW